MKVSELLEMFTDEEFELGKDEALEFEHVRDGAHWGDWHRIKDMIVHEYNEDPDNNIIEIVGTEEGFDYEPEDDVEVRIALYTYL